MIANYFADIANWFANLDDTCWILLIAVIIAAVGLYIARKQLCNLSNTSKANVLFNLEKKYDDIFKGRKAVHDLVTEIENRWVTEHSEGEDKLISEITREMQRLENEDKEKYSEIKQVLDFCEFIGYLMISGYLHPNEVKALYVPAILNWGKWFTPYIIQRRKKEGEDLYKYFILAYNKLSGQKHNN